jgi:hypothetical protein
LIGVAALLLGIVVGMLIQSGMSANQVASPTQQPQLQQQGAPQQAAPQLTPEQLQGGELPPGHPSIGATGSAPATP